MKVNFRYQRQNVLRFIKYQPKEFIDYPLELKNLMKKNNRFEIVYKNLKPYIRIDHASSSMKNFKPDEDDLKWEVDKFYKKVQTESINQYLN